MEILFLLSQDLESPSGLGRYLPLSRELAKLGHQVSIAALHPDFEALPNKHFEMDGVQVTYVAPMHVKKKGGQKEYYSGIELVWVAARATWQLARAALASRARIIHVGKPHPMNGAAGLLAKYLGGKTLFVDCDDNEVGSNRFYGLWQQHGVAFFERLLPRQAKLVTSNTHVTLKRLQNWGVDEQKLVYLPNGVDRLRFCGSDEKQVEALRQQLQLGDAPVIAYIGSLSLKNHAVDLLVEAFALVKKKRADACLMIVGGGEDLALVQAQCKALGVAQAVHFVGRVAPQRVADYYRLAAVTVDPVYDDEAARGRAPLKMFESWAAGTPFVTSAVGDRALLAGEPPAAVMAEPGDAADLARVLLEVLDHPELQAQLRQRGWQQVEHYYWDTITGRNRWIYEGD